MYIYTAHTCYKFVEPCEPKGSDDDDKFMRQKTLNSIGYLGDNILPEMFEIKFTLQSFSYGDAVCNNSCVTLHEAILAPVNRPVFQISWF